MPSAFEEAVRLTREATPSKTPDTTEQPEEPEQAADPFEDAAIVARAQVFATLAVATSINRLTDAINARQPEDTDEDPGGNIVWAADPGSIPAPTPQHPTPGQWLRGVRADEQPRTGNRRVWTA